MLKWRFMQYRNAFVCAALILAGDIEHHILPTVIPIPGQMAGDPLGTLCKQKELLIRALLDNCPRFVPPRTGFLQKEIRSYAGPYHFPSFYLILIATVFWQEITEVFFRSGNLSAVLAAQGVQISIIDAWHSQYCTAPLDKQVCACPIYVRTCGISPIEYICFS